MAVSLQQIADSLHLSKTTISWVLSGKGEEKGVSEQTIRLVRDYAKQIGYQPNLVARSLSLGYTQTIGLIIPSIGDTFYAQMAQAIEARASLQNFTLMVCSSERSEEKENELIQTLRSQRVAGLAIASAAKTSRNIQPLLNDRYPFVLIDRFIPDIETNYVIINNYDVSYNLTSWLGKSGCKRIVLLTTEMHLQVMKIRKEGYLRALSDYDNSGVIVEIDRDDCQADVYRKLDRLFDEYNDVDGFYFSTHYLALECIRYFIRKNINYSKLYRMACLHTTTALDLIAPRMLCSLMPIHEMGTEAVDILLSNIQHKTVQPFQKRTLVCTDKCIG